MVEARISTGIKGLDDTIQNGLPFKTLIHVYGESGTGKSTFAMQCAKNCVVNGWKVLVLDNERTCSSTRLKTICETNYTEIAQSIFVYEPASFENQSETIEALEKYITDKTKMIIIDTLTTQYRRALTEKSDKNILLNKNLNRQLAILKDLAMRFDLLVFVTNQVRGVMKRPDEKDGMEPVAAAILNYWADYEIRLDFLPDRQMSKRIATITKHQTKTGKLSIEVRLTDEGIQEG
ncbi:MAG: AAA family ATPase [Candidatus Helarchaeota archaeon]|nr:AAA family ATPase [Candidatus Helarchaeota archaeon]